jgi:branched-subunit amino acid ABC-type transport system permease component
METLLHAVGFGLITSAIVALSSIALTLQWGLSSVPNFAHGEFLTVGAYAAFAVQGFTHNLLAEAATAAVVGAVVACATNLWLIEPFRKAGMSIPLLFVVTIGVSIVLQNLVSFIFGAQVDTYNLQQGQPHHVGPFLLTTLQLDIIVLAVAVMLLLHLVLRYTTFGKSVRSVADDRQLARACGIPTTRVTNLTWLLAGGIAGVSGFALAVSTGAFEPTTGYSFLLVSFAATVIGGIGRPYGAALGALIVGEITEISAAYLSASYKQVFAVGLLVLFLFVKPSGLFTPTRQAA